MVTAQHGLAELRHARNASWQLMVVIGLFSFAVNLLMLTSPIFMLQIYDRVLGSRSVETLTALFLLVVFLFALMGILDFSRNRIMQRIAARFQTRIEPRIFQAALSEGAASGNDLAVRGGLRDLDMLRQVLASPVLMAIFDLPFAPLFLLAVFILHPVLGLIATLGGAILLIASWANQRISRRQLTASAQASACADRMSDLFRDESEVIGALGMRKASFRRWLGLRDEATETALGAGDITTGFSSFSKAFRLLLQSTILAAGAWLVLQNTITAGAMIAASILMGRALAPVDQLVGAWPQVQRGIDSWQRMAALLTRHPPTRPRTALPRPKARLNVHQLSVIPPGGTKPLLRGISFSLEPGTALGVIGPSGAGKSTLARALIGAWPAAGGEIRLGGALLDQYEPDILGQLIGYLPQQVNLFDGTITENIARLMPQPDAEKVIKAAKAAAAHQMILNLPDGYDTQSARIGSRLSGGQIQRVGLARALYGEPVLFILDEPNSNLDNEGAEALNAAIRHAKAAGNIVIIMAHRPAAIAECDYLLLLDQGLQRDFGPAGQVLRANVRNAPEISAARGRGVGVV